MSIAHINRFLGIILLRKALLFIILARLFYISIIGALQALGLVILIQGLQGGDLMARSIAKIF